MDSPRQMMDFHGDLSISNACFDWMVDVSSGCCCIKVRMNTNECVHDLMSSVESDPRAHYMSGDD